jgi:hypothetical protein
VKEQLPDKVRKLEGVIKRRPDREEVEDFLGGATLGYLIDVARTFSNVSEIEKDAMGNLNVITKCRKILEHPLKQQEEDIDGKLSKTLKLSLDYMEDVICL